MRIRTDGEPTHGHYEKVREPVDHLTDDKFSDGAIKALKVVKWGTYLGALAMTTGSILSTVSNNGLTLGEVANAQSELLAGTAVAFCLAYGMYRLSRYSEGWRREYKTHRVWVPGSEDYLITRGGRRRVQRTDHIEMERSQGFVYNFS